MKATQKAATWIALKSQPQAAKERAGEERQKWRQKNSLRNTVQMQQEKKGGSPEGPAECPLSPVKPTPVYIKETESHAGGWLLG